MKFLTSSEIFAPVFMLNIRSLFSIDLKVGVPVCLVKHENPSYLYFNSRNRKELSIHLKIFTNSDSSQSFMKIRRYQGEVIQFSSLHLKLSQVPLVRSDFHETLQEVSACEYLQVYREFFFNIFCQSKDMADFHALQGKLKSRP